MALTDVKVKAAIVPDDKKQIKLADGGGLYLLVNKTGKYWRLDYRYAGKRKTLAIGIYPIITLKSARVARELAKEQLSQGVDPSQAKKDAEAARRAVSYAATFESVAREWFASYKKDLSENYAAKVMTSLEQNVFPWLGPMPIKDIKAALVLETLKRIANRGAEETARRVKALCSQVFCYAVLHHDLDQDPTMMIKGFLKNKKKKHYACITDAKKAGELMRAMHNFDGTFVVKSALLLTPYLFLRPGELRQLEWQDIDFEHNQIKLAAEKMKMKEVHIVPLSRQAISILKDI